MENVSWLAARIAAHPTASVIGDRGITPALIRSRESIVVMILTSGALGRTPGCREREESDIAPPPCKNAYASDRPSVSGSHATAHANRRARCRFVREGAQCSLSLMARAGVQP